jgi:hypothetical protein
MWVNYSLRFAFTDELPVDRYINPARPAADGHRRGARSTDIQGNLAVRMPTAI